MLSLNFILTVFFGIILFSMVGLMREPDGFQKIIENPSQIIHMLLSYLNGILTSVSYAYTQIYIIYTFDFDNFWYGEIFATIPLRLLGISGYPIDDGVYIRSLAEGLQADPLTLFENLFPSSWPPETFGMGYANFGVIGVICFAFSLGIVHGFIYKSIYYSFGIDVFTSILYFYTLFNFQFTNLRIVQYISFIIVLIMVYYIWLFIIKAKNGINSTNTKM